MIKLLMVHVAAVLVLSEFYLEQLLYVSVAVSPELLSRTTHCLDLLDVSGELGVVSPHTVFHHLCSAGNQDMFITTLLFPLNGLFELEAALRESVRTQDALLSGEYVSAGRSMHQSSNVCLLVDL